MAKRKPPKVYRDENLQRFYALGWQKRQETMGDMAFDGLTLGLFSFFDDLSMTFANDAEKVAYERGFNDAGDVDDEDDEGDDEEE